ncbi:uncharacterized protein MONOS_14027 [Monocercomonoides exilis]|uniref:uncharacterized protein n=1 Tax=Monocercomonoides exilis TaxID=2049356 RepID=UPI003559BF2E|nr:hypothetical protein MONOS_14027 [Monocercomonoides exilis]|eukprot:MONOS_14027.1-p1 / transcript=MONOS_14027.1 / gene=MONOS_14027 / organism=Monocercomonoides_exilis_PA203 / gene_product=unspecified product / transcript_product=unspecified product / location=Mono_scaffold00924:10847-11430(+) / protein_length=156 / sequence_SO=supercontig / SO=protein_coding / is_pseudo=false
MEVEEEEEEGEEEEMKKMKKKKKIEEEEAVKRATTMKSALHFVWEATSLVPYGLIACVAITTGEEVSTELHEITDFTNEAIAMASFSSDLLDSSQKESELAAQLVYWTEASASSVKETQLIVFRNATFEEQVVLSEQESFFSWSVGHVDCSWVRM